MTSVVVTVLCNQPEAFALDLGDDQSCYSLLSLCIVNRSTVAVLSIVYCRVLVHVVHEVNAVDKSNILQSYVKV